MLFGLSLKEIAGYTTMTIAFPLVLAAFFHGTWYSKRMKFDYSREQEVDSNMIIKCRGDKCFYRKDTIDFLVPMAVSFLLMLSGIGFNAWGGIKKRMKATTIATILCNIGALLCIVVTIAFTLTEANRPEEGIRSFTFNAGWASSIIYLGCFMLCFSTSLIYPEAKKKLQLETGKTDKDVHE